MTILRTLLMHHRPVLDESLGVVVDAINAEVLNLRSQVARVAICLPWRTSSRLDGVVWMLFVLLHLCSRPLCTAQLV